MSKNNLISVRCFNREVGRLGFDEHRNASFFQYSPEFLAAGLYRNLFPLVIRRIAETQVFNKYTQDTFRGLPPVIADSLPDVFGNIVFKAWLESSKGGLQKISVLEQLAYVGRRGMGALEYEPGKEVKGETTINIDEITIVVEEVLKNKSAAKGSRLDSASLINIFKIGTSAGGIRPKILVSEHKQTAQIIPGDLACSADYNHYLVKLNVDEQLSYSREVIEYIYSLMARSAGITMMPAKLIEGRHFATLRFDRRNGEKMHVLTATGLTGLDYKDPAVSTYENLFDLAVFLKVPHRNVEELFRRMVFNLVFANHDDHLKNHSFIYDKDRDRWELAPAYDLTYSLNPELAYNKISRALSVNGKRTDILISDILAVAERYTVKNPRGILGEITAAISMWEQLTAEAGVPRKIADSIRKEFKAY